MPVHRMTPSVGGTCVYVHVAHCFGWCCSPSVHAMCSCLRSLAGGPLDASEGQQQDKAQQTEAAQQQQPPGQGAAGPVGDDEQRKWAVADKQQDYYDQLLRENVTREDLLKTLAEYNVPAADNESIVSVGQHRHVWQG